MQLGRHLHELWRYRAALLASLVISLLAALWSVDRIRLVPPGLQSRSLEMAAASTRALVDTPKSTVLDLSMNTYDFNAITNRALLVGNVMASEPVRGYIARRAHVPARRIQVASPVTIKFPRQLASSGEKHASDILKSPDQYRLSIQVNPTAPVLDIYAQAPTTKGAEQLANGAVDGMKDYLRALGVREGVPPAAQVNLQQLGRATGGELNSGVSLKVGVLTFMLAFLACSVTVLSLTRVRRGWVLEAMRERGQGTLAMPSLRRDPADS